MSIVDSSKNEVFVFGPINGAKSAVLIGDESKNSWLKGWQVKLFDYHGEISLKTSLHFSLAISFALGYSNEISSLPREFHNFNGSVELICVFDRNDTTEAFFKDFSCNQFGNKFSLRRSIHLQQIEYFLCDARVERLNVKDFLEMFGFAHLYPFQNTVDKDDVCMVEMSDSEYRLSLLKNCCGVGEFREKRNKTERILKETEERIRKIDMSLEKINVQINIFASDETQQIYQNWVKREKELGHFQRLYRIKKLQADLHNWDTDMDKLTASSDAIKMDIIQNAESGKELRLQIKFMRDKINELKLREQEFQREIERIEKTILELRVSMKNLQVLTQQGSLNEELSAQEMTLYRERIDISNTQIREFDAKITQIAAQKSVIDQHVGELESQAAAIVLNCKQNTRLGTKFPSIDKRNEYLLKQIKKFKAAINRESRAATKLTVQLQDEMTELQSLREYFGAYNEQLEQLNADEQSSSFNHNQQLIDNLEVQRWYISTPPSL